MMQRQRRLVSVFTLPFLLSITLGWSQTQKERESPIAIRPSQSQLAAKADKIVVAEMKAQRVVGVAIGRVVWATDVDPICMEIGMEFMEIDPLALQMLDEMTAVEI